MVIQILVMGLIILAIIGYRQSRRGKNLNNAIDNLNDAKSKIEIHKINKEADDLIASINQDNGEQNERD